MEIRRAGPFADEDSSYLDEVDSPTSPSDARPVNCADRAWIGKAFQVLQIESVRDDSFYESVSDGTNFSYFEESVDLSPVTFDEEGVYWFYQASQPFTMTGSYSGSHTGGAGGEFVGIEVSVGGNVEYSDSNNTPGFGTISGTWTADFPATVVPSPAHIRPTGEDITLEMDFTINLS
jgi:hypothetical protein